jgi:hypothetical protein
MENSKMGNSTLVKIDSELYEIVKSFVEVNKFEYPSIKNFVEQAVIKSLGFKKYDIEGVDDELAHLKPLKKVVGNFQKGFSLCVVCSRPFLRNAKETNEASKICPNCKQTIAHFAPKILNNQTQNDKKEVKSNK